MFKIYVHIILIKPLLSNYSIMKNILIGLCIGVFFYQSFAQKLTEINHQEIISIPTENYQIPYLYNDIAIDQDGNKVIVGGFEGKNIDFGGTALSSINNSNIFIAKYNRTNELVWIKNIGNDTISTNTEVNDAAKNIVIDHQNNIYVSGVIAYSGDPVDFDPEHPYTDSITNSINTLWGSSTGIFLAKYSPDGELLWIHMFSDESKGLPKDLSISNSGDVYLSGIIKNSIGSTIDFDPDNTYNDQRDILEGDLLDRGFIAHYDPFGNFKKVISLFAPENDNMIMEDLYLTVSDSGNIYITGGFSGKLQFAKETNGQPAPAYMSTGSYELSYTNPDMFIAKYTSTGTLQWAKVISSIKSNKGKSIALDAQENIYLTGSFMGKDIDFDPNHTLNFDTTSSNIGKTSAFIAKYDTSGVLNWLETVHGQKELITVGRSIIVSGNSVLTSGQFTGSNVLFGEKFLSSTSSSIDAFIAYLDTSGNWLDIIQKGSNDYINIPSISIDNNENLYVMGHQGNIQNLYTNQEKIFFSTYEISQPLSTNEQTLSVNKVYPTLFEDSITIKFGTNSSIATISVFNNVGQLIHKKAAIHPPKTTIQFHGVPAGIYLIKIQTHNHSSMHKVIKK